MKQGFSDNYISYNQLTIFKNLFIWVVEQTTLIFWVALKKRLKINRISY